MCFYTVSIFAVETVQVSTLLTPSSDKVDYFRSAHEISVPATKWLIPKQKAAAGSENANAVLGQIGEKHGILVTSGCGENQISSPRVSAIHRTELPLRSSIEVSLLDEISCWARATCPLIAAR